MKHGSLKGCVSLFLIIFFFHITTNAQEIYVRVSEKDCINCYIGFFSELLDNSQPEFKFLFPENIQGKHFDNFNQMYFQGKVSLDNVVFSDSLFQKTKQPLNALSGLVLMDKGEVLMDFSSKEASKYDIDTLLGALSQTKKIFDFKEDGVSSRFSSVVDSEGENLLVIDDLFRKLYFLDENGALKTIDLKDEAFQLVIQNTMEKTAYEFHKKNIGTLKRFKKNFPESFSAIIKNDSLYLRYFMPCIQEEKNGGLGIRNELFLSKMPFEGTKINIENMINNTYLVRKDPQKRYYPTFSFTAIYPHFYQINQMIYTQEDLNNKTRFPLFIRYVFDEEKKEISFEGFSELKNFSFQQDTTLNSNDLIIDISFLNFADQILLKHKPYAVDIEEGRKYKLDWDANMNDIHYPQTITYENLQLWGNKSNFVVLAKIKNEYFVKVYDKKWELIKKIAFPFNPNVVEKIRFTKENIYIFTENHILKMDNFVQGRLKSL